MFLKSTEIQETNQPEINVLFLIISKWDNLRENYSFEVTVTEIFKHNKPNKLSLTFSTAKD